MFAQNVSFTAEAKESKIGVKDHVQVQFQVRDVQNLISITPLNSPDFIIIAGPFQQQTSQYVNVNNRSCQSQRVTLTYILQPRREGNLVIPPATAKDASGKVYQSNSVAIEVVPQSALQQSRKPIR